ncbi:MAG: SRPBCC family protein [Anaerolineae bacterium]|nr:SRPBCC family protein [Anaerolineae bacterium]
MALIDQRILINAPADVVWELLTDPARLPGWHMDYTGVSVLTTSAQGAGARRRCTLASGKDVIEQITAWVEGLGYEYAIVEGGPYHTYQARLRLQAGPDGISVQWTVSYQPKGFFGAIRDLVGGKRRMAGMMAASLRQLRRDVDALGVRMPEEERSKVSIRGRLNADERAQYQRRYEAPPIAQATAPDQAPIPTPPDAMPAVTPGEPPLAAPASTPPTPSDGTPSFVADLTREPEEPDYSHTADTKPKAPKGLREAIAKQQAEQETQQDEPAEPAAPVFAEPGVPDIPPDHAPYVRPVTTAPPVEPPQPDALVPPPPVRAPVQEVDPTKKTPPRGIPSVQPAAPAPAEEAPTPPPSDVKKKTPPRGIPRSELEPPGESQAADQESQRSGLPPQTPVTDTGEISIWEIFGERRPSERDTHALTDLIETVQARQIVDRLVDGRLPKRPVHVRQLGSAIGLRLNLAWGAVRVRLHRSMRSGDEQD